MPGSSKLFRENHHINELTVLENPIAKITPENRDTGDYFNTLPLKCEIQKGDRNAVINIKEELNAGQTD